MRQNLQISTEIEKNEYRKAYDEHCKKLLSNKQILAHILKNCVEEYREIELDDIPSYIETIDTADSNQKIKGLNTEDETISGAMIKYDILFESMIPNSKDKLGLIINIEAQNRDNPGYNLVSRAFYYCSRLLARQKNSPEGFEKSEYDHLKKVYSIWICMNHRKDKDDAITMYTITEQCIQNQVRCPKEIYDLLSVVMLYPKKEYDYDDNQKSLLEMLSLLLSSSVSADKKKTKLHEDYGIIMAQEIETEVDTMCNLSQGVFDDGVEKATIQHIQNLVETCHITPEKAMEMLKIEESQRPQYAKAIHAQKMSNLK